ncbi:hypothetical protein HMPREF0381_0162 [Lachnoanaerobaculum saburreum DSM 3986]|uniref:Uncharacterized protein n=1 Tax=Lachnoanaerobaculum saburreum DSM 3986 TaxID=887325 RepID=E6LJM7_9FIRM|nr:hypothetical protein HMPREF0381_0162 [Lachnoanaerobaculum saburreum DSM 3986]
MRFHRTRIFMNFLHLSYQYIISIFFLYKMIALPFMDSSTQFVF